jgi:CRP-like cAMP-binding protein
LLVLFVVYRAQLRNAEAKEFEGGEEEHSRLGGCCDHRENPSTFIGDIAVFTGEPTIAAGVAADTMSPLAMPREALRKLVVGSAELGDLILRTMIARRERLQGHGYGQERLIGTRRSSGAFAVREPRQRSLVPFT